MLLQILLVIILNKGIFSYLLVVNIDEKYLSSSLSKFVQSSRLIPHNDYSAFYRLLSDLQRLFDNSSNVHNKYLHRISTLFDWQLERTILFKDTITIRRILHLSSKYKLPLSNTKLKAFTSILIWNGKENLAIRLVSRVAKKITIRVRSLIPLIDHYIETGKIQTFPIITKIFANSYYPNKTPKSEYSYIIVSILQTFCNIAHIAHEQYTIKSIHSALSPLGDWNIHLNQQQATSLIQSPQRYSSLIRMSISGTIDSQINHQVISKCNNCAQSLDLVIPSMIHKIDLDNKLILNKIER